jgi:type IV secretory pathway VirB10-like protein
MSETEAPDVNEPEAPDLEPVPPPEPDEEGEQAEPAEGQPPQPEAEPNEPESSAELARRDKALDGLNKHVAKRLTEILGDDATAYTPCEICTAFGTPGWRPGGDLPAEVKVIVSHALGVQTADDLEQAEDTARCGACGGRGYVRTGSLVPDFESAMCLSCQGRGWVATDERRRVLIGGEPNGAHSGTNAQNVTITRDYNEAIPEPPEAAQLRAAGYVVMAPPNLTGS